MKRKILLPIAIVGVGVIGIVVMVKTRPEPQQQPRPDTSPVVRVVTAKPEAFTYTVLAQGSVVPRTESDLVAQVSGEVVWVSPSFVSGGFFAKGDPLVRIDPRDQALELDSARAALARAQSEYARRETEIGRQRLLHEEGVASQARIDDAELAFRVADAALREARARLARAERDLERTELRAAFEGRVRTESVDVGQFIDRGRAIARLYAVDFAEVRLPIPDRELRFLDLPLGATSGDPGFEGPPVVLRAEFAGEPRSWTGKVVRTEGEIDPRSRMVTLVARVEDPYGVRTERSDAPLAVGLFVEAEIEGRTEPEAFVLPRSALQPGSDSTLHVVDADGRLHIRTVEVLRTERDRIIVSSGLEPGEQVSISPLRAVIDGMAVRVAAEASTDDAPEIARTAEPAR